MEIVLRLIILNTTRIGEKSLVLHCLTREMGRRSFMVTVSKSAGMACFLPLNVLECVAVENPRSELWRVHGISVCYPLNGIRGSLSKNTMTLFMSEVLYRAIREGAHEYGLFDWCERSILTLDALEADYANYHLRFLMELASQLGFSPSAEGLAPFAGEYMKTLQALLQSSFAEFMVFPLSGAERNAMAEVLLRYISCHAETRIEARSLPVLRELFR